MKKRYSWKAAIVAALGLMACQPTPTGSQGQQRSDAAPRAERSDAQPHQESGDSGLGGSGRLAFDEEEFDFGDVEQGTRVTHNFKIKNVGTEVLHIKNVRGS